MESALKSCAPESELDEKLAKLQKLIDQTAALVVDIYGCTASGADIPKPPKPKSHFSDVSTASGADIPKPPKPMSRFPDCGALLEGVIQLEKGLDAYRRA